MAEEDTELELETLQRELQGLLSASVGHEHGLQGKFYCAKFCQLVEEYTGRWQVPLPQLQVLRSALCAFVHGTSSFPSDCEHVRYTLGSLALSIFELLLFFGKDEFPEDPLKDILDSFQECHSSLVRYQDVYLLQVKHIIREGGPWASPVLEGILKELDQPQEEVEKYLSSEVPLFFELRVRYLLACERTQEAMALSRRCSQHPTTCRHMYFKQAHLVCLWKTSQQDRLFTEMAEFDGKDAVEILCLAELEEKDNLLLELSRGFLLQQLRSGDMYHIWDLVFIWCKVSHRVNASKAEFLEECKRLIVSATNVKAIFPFIKAILAEQMGKEGLTFCIELCAWALETDLRNDPLTKSLIYKTIAYLFPSDLEVCRACALLVFFLECTVEAYKTVFLLYNHPDLEYHPESSSVGNNIRFEVIQILKKGLFFDPEFWSLLNIKTNCLKLMSDEVARDALFEIMEEDKWASNYCVRKNCVCRPEPDRTDIREKTEPANGVKKESEMSKQAKAQSQSETYQTRMRKRMQLTEDSVRRLRQSDSAQNHGMQMNRLLTRQAEKILLKRRGRRPRWLLEQLASHEVTSVRREGKKPGRKPKQKTEAVVEETEDTPIIEITLEYSYPDNEVEIPAKTGSTEGKPDDPENPAQPSSITPNSLHHLLLEESTQAFSEKDNVTECFSSLDVSVIRQFHAYAIVPAHERTSLNSSTASVVKVPHEVEPDIPMEIPLLVKKSSEPLKVYPAKTKISSSATPIPPELPSQSLLNRHTDAQLSSISNPEPAVDAGNVDKTLKRTNPYTERSTGQSDSTHTAENALAKILDCHEKTYQTVGYKPTDHTSSNERASEKASDTNPTSENVLQTSTKTTLQLAREKTAIPAPKKVPNGNETPHTRVFTNLPAVQSVNEVKPQQTQEVGGQTLEEKPLRDRPSVNNGLPPAQIGLAHRCKLCNEECSNSEVLKHALWHYRTEKMCMFCPNFTNWGGALYHFKKHIRDHVPLETKPEDVIAPTEKPDQTVPVSMHKKPKPGFAQIKSKLLMRIQLKSKASVAEKSCSSDEKALTPKEDEAVKKSPLSQEPKGGCRAEERHTEEASLKPKMPYLTRGLVKKTEMKQKILRMRLARKAKSGSTKADRGRSAPKDHSVHRKNGVIWKKRKIKDGDASRTADKTVQPVNDESTKQKTETIKDETKHDKEGSVNCYKSEVKPKEQKRKSEQKQDVKADKKRRVSVGPGEEPEARRNPEEQQSVPTKQDSVTSDCSKISESQSKSSRVHSLIKCPIETCTFQARLNPLFCHVLSNHPGDTKPLELLFHISQKKCVFCTRRIFTPRHFCDHIMRHRGQLRHPCYDADCRLKFKTRPELSEHMQNDHCPLKAVCSFPKCTVQFDGLKLLYEHEKKHYKMASENVTWEAHTSVAGKGSEDDSSTSESGEGKECRKTTAPFNLEQENTKRVNGHSNHEDEMCSEAPPTPNKEDPKTPLVAAKPFSRPPPSAYLDELYLTMPKRWKGPHLSPKGSETSVNSPSKKQHCSRCTAAFDSEVELQQHRSKCTSLFGFDSDDENSF